MSLRPRIYDTPHKGLRNALSQWSFLAGSTDYTDTAAVAKLQALGHEVLSMLTSHAHDEDRVILGAIAAQGGNANADKDDHHRLEGLQDALAAQLHAMLPISNDPMEAHKLGAAHYDAINRYMIDYYKHMDQEETVTQAMLWELFTDEELMGIVSLIQGNIPPEKMLIWLKYILPALSPQERQYMFGAIRSFAPPEFFEEALLVAKSVLPSVEGL